MCSSFSKVTGIEVDEEAVDVCRANVEEFEMENFEVIIGDVTKMDSAIVERLKVGMEYATKIDYK